MIGTSEAFYREFRYRQAQSLTFLDGHTPRDAFDVVLGYEVASTLKSGRDRASRGDYEDRGGPAIRTWLQQALQTPWETRTRVILDEYTQITTTRQELCDIEGCCLVVTTGGTGPALRDVTPDATAAVYEKILDGFAEQRRAASLRVTPTAILSRQIAGIQGRSLILNLPGNPPAIADCLTAVFPAIPYCVDLIGGPY